MDPKFTIVMFSRPSRGGLGLACLLACLPRPSFTPLCGPVAPNTSLQFQAHIDQPHWRGTASGIGRSLDAPRGLENPSAPADRRLVTVLVGSCRRQRLCRWGGGILVEYSPVLSSRIGYVELLQ